MLYIAKIVQALCYILTLSSCEPICHYLSIEDDNDTEEEIEAIIERKTGLDIDITPSSRE